MQMRSKLQSVKNKSKSTKLSIYNHAYLTLNQKYVIIVKKYIKIQTQEVILWFFRLKIVVKHVVKYIQINLLDGVNHVR